MNEYGTRCSYEEKINFPYNEYPYINFENTISVTLIDKSWPVKDNGYLILAFITDSNIKFRINVWRNTNPEYYMPDKSEIDFSKILPNTKWLCTFKRTRNGNIRWKTAEPI